MCVCVCVCVYVWVCSCVCVYATVHLFVCMCVCFLLHQHMLHAAKILNKITNIELNIFTPPKQQFSVYTPTLLTPSKRWFCPAYAPRPIRRIRHGRPRRLTTTDIHNVWDQGCGLAVVSIVSQWSDTVCVRGIRVDVPASRLLRRSSGLGSGPHSVHPLHCR